MYIDSAIRKYLDDASSNSPTPGGGSVAALAGSVGVSMACMAANFTLGKKKYKDVEAEAQELLGNCASVRDGLAALMDEDTEAYGTVSAAYAMPKSDPEEKKARAQAIQRALKVAMDAPLRAVRACRTAMRDIRRLVDVANPNLISDVGVAAVLVEAALRAAKMNVEINLSFLKDEQRVKATRQEIEDAAQEARTLSLETVTKVAEAIGGSV